MASPTSGRARRRHGPGCASRGIRPGRSRRSPSWPPRTSRRPRSPSPSSSTTSRSTSRSSAAGRWPGRRGGCERAGKSVRVLDAHAGDEVVAIYAGPMVVVRTEHGHAPRPSARDRRRDRGRRGPAGRPGNRLAGIVTARAAESSARPAWTWAAVDAVDRGWCASKARMATSAPSSLRPGDRRGNDDAGRHRRGRPWPRPARSSRPDGRRRARHRRRRRRHRPAAPRRRPRRHLRLHGHDRRRPRRRLGPWLHRTRAPQARQPGLPRPVPGRRLPAQRPLVDRRQDGRGRPTPFTARPASRQNTLAEASADTYVDAFRKTPLHDEHLAAGARMDRFGGWWRPWHYGDAVSDTGRSARASRSATSRRSASWSSRGRTSSSCSSGSIRVTSRTSSRVTRATRCCSTSAATSWTTG